MESLPPGVKASGRGILEIEVLDSPGNVYILWWGAQQEQCLIPRTHCSEFDEPVVKIPIRTSPERFVAYLKDDPVLDVRVSKASGRTIPKNQDGGPSDSDSHGVIDMLPFITKTDLNLDGQFNIGTEEIKIRMRSVWNTKIKKRKDKEAREDMEAREANDRNNIMQASEIHIVKPQDKRDRSPRDTDKEGGNTPSDVSSVRERDDRRKWGRHISSVQTNKQPSNRDPTDHQGGYDSGYQAGSRQNNYNNGQNYARNYNDQDGHARYDKEYEQVGHKTGPMSGMPSWGPPSASGPSSIMEGGQHCPGHASVGGTSSKKEEYLTAVTQTSQWEALAERAERLREDMKASQREERGNVNDEILLSNILNPMGSVTPHRGTPTSGNFNNTSGGFTPGFENPGRGFQNPGGNYSNFGGGGGVNYTPNGGNYTPNGGNNQNFGKNLNFGNYSNHRNQPPDFSNNSNRNYNSGVMKFGGSNIVEGGGYDGFPHNDNGNYGRGIGPRNNSPSNNNRERFNNTGVMMESMLARDPYHGLSNSQNFNSGMQPGINQQGPGSQGGKQNEQGRNQNGNDNSNQQGSGAPMNTLQHPPSNEQTSRRLRVTLQSISVKNISLKRLNLNMKTKLSGQSEPMYSQKVQTLVANTREGASMTSSLGSDFLSKVFFSWEKWKARKGIMEEVERKVYSEKGQHSANPLKDDESPDQLKSRSIILNVLSNSEESIRLCNLTGYSSLVANTKKQCENCYSAELKFKNVNLNQKTEYVIPIYREEEVNARKHSPTIIGRAYLHIEEIPITNSLKLEIGPLRNFGLQGGMYSVSYKVPLRNGEVQEIETPSMCEEEFKFTAVHRFQDVTPPPKLFFQVYSGNQNLVGVCKVTVPWPNGDIICTVHPLLGSAGVGMGGPLPSLDVTLSCTSGHGSSCDHTNGGNLNPSLEEMRSARKNKSSNASARQVSAGRQGSAAGETSPDRQLRLGPEKLTAQEQYPRGPSNKEISRNRTISQDRQSAGMSRSRGVSPNRPPPFQIQEQPVQQFQEQPFQPSSVLLYGPINKTEVLNKLLENIPSSRFFENYEGNPYSAGVAIGLRKIISAAIDNSNYYAQVYEINVGVQGGGPLLNSMNSYNYENGGGDFVMQSSGSSCSSSILNIPLIPTRKGPIIGGVLEHMNSSADMNSSSADMMSSGMSADYNNMGNRMSPDSGYDDDIDTPEDNLQFGNSNYGSGYHDYTEKLLTGPALEKYLMHQLPTLTSQDVSMLVQEIFASGEGARATSTPSGLLVGGTISLEFVRWWLTEKRNQVVEATRKILLFFEPKLHQRSCTNMLKALLSDIRYPKDEILSSRQGGPQSGQNQREQQNTPSSSIWFKKDQTTGRPMLTGEGLYRLLVNKILSDRDWENLRREMSSNQSEMSKEISNQSSEKSYVREFNKLDRALTSCIQCIYSTCMSDGIETDFLFLFFQSQVDSLLDSQLRGRRRMGEIFHTVFHKLYPNVCNDKSQNIDLKNLLFRGHMYEETLDLLENPDISRLKRIKKRLFVCQRKSFEHIVQNKIFGSDNSNTRVWEDVSLLADLLGIGAGGVSGLVDLDTLDLEFQTWIGAGAGISVQIQGQLSSGDYNESDDLNLNTANRAMNIEGDALGGGSLEGGGIDPPTLAKSSPQSNPQLLPESNGIPGSEKSGFQNAATQQSSAISGGGYSIGVVETGNDNDNHLTMLSNLNQKLPSHPASINIIKELLSLIISGCLQIPDVTSILDQATSLISKHPERDDVAIAVAAWKEISISSTGLPAVLALQAFTTYDKLAGRMRVTESNIENMKKVFFYCYDFEQNSIFLKLFEVILASHVDPLKAFQILDSDKDGCLTIDDFIRMLKKLGLPLSASDKQAFQRYGNKTITLEAFLESFNRFRGRRFGYNEDETAVGTVVRADNIILAGEASRRDMFLKTNQYCFNLPPYLTFALLEDTETHSVSRGTFERFVYEVLGGGIMSKAEASRTVDLLDVTNKDNKSANLSIAYKDFRRYFRHVDSKRSITKPDHETLLKGLRTDVREFLDLATSAEISISDTLQSVSLGENDPVTEGGLKTLFSELRISTGIAKPLYEWSTTVAAFRRVANIGNYNAGLSGAGFRNIMNGGHRDGHPLLGDTANNLVSNLGVINPNSTASLITPSNAITYKVLFGEICPRAHYYLRRHLDDLFTVLMFTGVHDLLAFIGKSTVPSENFKDLVIRLLKKHREELKKEGSAAELALDWEDIMRSITHRGYVSVTELDLTYKEFLCRYGVLLQELAKRMEALQISSAELFSTAKKQLGR